MKEFLTKSELDRELRIDSNTTNFLYSYIDEDNSLPIIKKKSVSTRDFFQSLYNNLNENKENKTNLINPPNCRYVESMNGGDETIFVIEEPPMFRTVNIELNLSLQYENAKIKYSDIDNYFSINNGIYKFKLAFPNMIFIFIIDKYYTTRACKVFCTKTNIIGMGDTLYKTPLPNISSSQTICFGYESKDSKTSYTKTINERITSFWCTSFNTDYRENILIYEKIPIIQNFFEWAYMSENNPMFVYNIDWISHDKTLGDVIKNIRYGYTYRENRENRKLNFQGIINTILHPPTVINQSKSEKLIDIASNYHIPGEDFDITIGDSFINKKTNKRFYIESLLCREGRSILEYILLSDDNNNKYLLKFISNCIKFLKEQLIESFNEFQLTDNLKIKIGDFLKIDNGYAVIYKEVKSIRTSRGFENETEIKLGLEYYFSSYLKNLNISIFDLNNVEIQNKKLIKDNTYFLMSSDGLNNSIKTYIPAKFKKINIVSNEISCSFKTDEGENITINLSDNSRKKRIILEENELEKLPAIFLYYNKLCYEEGGVYKYNNNLLKNSYDNYVSTSYFKGPTKYNYINDILNENKTELTIKGFHFDISYKIGDFVITGSIDELYELQRVKIVSGFVQDDNLNLYILLQDSNDLNKEPERFKLINGITKNVHLYSIRKVTTSYNSIDIGDKIIAKEKGIANFPKKDCNQILSIIIDSPFEPLVLCSNGCTLWYSTIENKFDIIKTNDDKWSGLEICTDVKINLQNGDIVKSNDNRLKILVNYRDVKATKSIYINNYTEVFYYESDLKRFLKPVSKTDTLFGIPLPRISKSKELEIEKLNGFIDLYGYIHESNSLFYFNDNEPQ